MNRYMKEGGIMISKEQKEGNGQQENEDLQLADKYKEIHFSKSYYPQIRIKEVWRDNDNILCIRYCNSFGKELDWYHYDISKKDKELVWW